MKHKVQCHEIYWLNFMNRTHQSPLINRLKWFCWKVRFRGYIRKIRDSALTNTAGSQTPHWLTLMRGVRKIKSAENPKMTNTALSQTILFFAFEHLHLQGIQGPCVAFRNIFENFPKIQNSQTLRGVSELNFPTIQRWQTLRRVWPSHILSLQACPVSMPWKRILIFFKSWELFLHRQTFSVRFRTSL